MSHDVTAYASLINSYLLNPDKYVYPFTIKEKNGKERTIITYNKFGQFGPYLRTAHSNILEAFQINFAERNMHSFAYHKNVRCYDALKSHLKSNVFIKLDIHHFFESITEEAFFDFYSEYFNKEWKNAIKGLFYKGSLSIGFVSSPAISDFYMKKFDNEVEDYLKDHDELHYSRYSDDILISSELKDDQSLNEFFDFIKARLAVYHLEINEKKTKKVSLDLNTHNSISFLGLNLSKIDDINNKVTISKRYILFILFLIAKQKRYTDHCYALENEIKSRVAYLAYNSPISFQRFQKKHINIYGEPFDFVPNDIEKRSEAQEASEIPNFEEYSKLFQINIHKNITKKEIKIKDAIEIEKYLGSNLTEVEIPYFVDSIGENAFRNHHEIKKVKLNAKLKIIDDRAFDSTSLEEVNLVDSLRYIGISAFAFTRLSKVSITNKIKTIESYAFQFSSVREVTISEGTESISSSAFANCGSLKKVNLPSSLKEIKSHAFENCSNLIDINLKDTSLETIDYDAFKNCSILSKVDLPDSLIQIGSNAFGGCLNLKSIKIPASVLDIDYRAFDNCPNLTSIDIDKNNKVYLHRNDNSTIVDINKTLHFTLKGDIDEDIVALGPSLFENSLIKEIVIPDHVQVINENVFKNARLLKHVKLPNSLVNIGSGAFQGCLSLTNISIPNKVKKIPPYCFFDCVNLKEVSMSDDVISFDNYAFANCSSLNVKLPKSLVKIGGYALSNCTNVKDLYIPENVKSIKRDAFRGLSNSLETIKVDPLNAFYSSGDNSNIIYQRRKANLILGCRNSKIDPGIKSINKFAFAYCDGLVDISIPNTLKVIGDSAFIGCKNLKRIDLNLVNIIAPHAFQRATSLVHVDLPSSLITLGADAFNGSGLNDISLPESLINIDNCAFHNCFNLERIFISSTFKPEFVSKAFENIASLKEIKVDSKNPYFLDVKNALVNKDGVLLLGSSQTVFDKCIKVIDSKAFYGNQFIKEIVLPESIANIRSNAFAYSSLRKIDIQCSDCFIGQAAFSGCKELKEVKLPKGLQSVESNTFSSCLKLKHIALPNDLNSIKYSAFKNSGLEEIVLPESLVYVGDSAFKYTNLKKVDIPKSVESIQNECFSSCKYLTSVKLGNKTKFIGSGAFRHCEALKDINLPDSIESIESKAFRGCHNLSIARLPASLKSLYQYAFAGCKSIDKLHVSKDIIFFDNTAFLKCDIGSIEVDKDHPSLKDFKSNIIAYVDQNSKLTHLLLGCKSSSIPEEINVIDNGAFAYRYSLESFKCPENLLTIGQYAFNGCSNLKEVLFNNKLEHVCCGAFDGTNIRKIYIPSSLKDINLDGLELDEIKVDKNNKFYIANDSNVLMTSDYAVIKTAKDAKVPNDARLIRKGCYDKQKLDKVTLSDSLAYLNGFDNSGVIEEFYISKSVRSIDHFANNTFIKKIFVDKDNLWFETNEDNTILYDKTKSIVYSSTGAIPEGVTNVNNFSGLNNEGASKLLIPSTLFNLDAPNGLSWSNITAHKVIVVAKDNPLYESISNVAIIRKRDRALICLLAGQKIPDSVSRVTSRVFANNNTIKSIEIPANMTYAEIGAFAGLDNVEKITVDKDNKVFEVKDGCLMLKDSNIAILKTKDATLPNNVINAINRRYAINDDLPDIAGQTFRANASSNNSEVVEELPF